jgi:acetaldehyde dehydrogenase (acetylating)
MLHDQDLVSVQEVRTKVEKAHAAWLTYKNFTQEQIDAVVEAVAEKARANARRLAEMAVEETGMGNVEDKYAKNMLCSEQLLQAIRPMKTVGVLREIPEKKIIEIGVPQGVVAAICPTTNPTSTVIFKTIISLKAGNAVVHSPHPRARQCTCATAALLSEAAVAAGAPADLIQCLTQSTLDATQALMRHPKTGVILATGGSGMVRAAYSSGKPAFGVGPGNVPVLLDSSADLPAAVGMLVAGKRFDFGTVCSSEQTLVTEVSLRDRVLAELKAQHAYLMNASETAAVTRTLFTGGTTVRAECVGKSPVVIAQMAGISVPAHTSILVGEIQGIGKEHPMSAEKLSPVLALLFTENFEASMDACENILKFGGTGHTCVIYAKDDEKVRRFGQRMPAFRIVVNSSAPQGSVGITTGLQPSMTLGCGAMAGNITSDNVGPQHLINIKRIAWAIRTPEQAVSATPVSAAVDKGALVAAVEKYLVQRGVNVSRQTVASSVAAVLPPAPAPQRTVPAQSVVASVVDRFLASRSAAAPAPAPAPTCGCGTKSSEPEPPRKAEIPAPPVEIADFVCEADVRTALSQGKKIYIGPKTIVTPSARELAGRDEILVNAQR